MVACGPVGAQCDTECHVTPRSGRSDQRSADHVRRGEAAARHGDGRSRPDPALALRSDAAVAAARDELIGLSHSIHAEPELAFAETRSVAKVIEPLAARGFEIETGVADLPTAFRARYGSGELTVGLCAEYDALPEIGHACGHNIIAASTAGAALGLAEVADALGITVVVLGTPAEESGGGKILMLERGVFDDIAMAMMAHPGPYDIVGARSLALADLSVVFHGREAHASAAPEQGRNAGDAVTVAQVAIGLLRQHLRPGQQLHGIVGDGGVAPNIVPGRAELLYYLRAADSASLGELMRRASDCFEAGALATGCTHDIRTLAPTYTELTPDPALLSAYREQIMRPRTDADRARARSAAPAREHGHGQRHQRHPGDTPGHRDRCRWCGDASARFRRGQRQRLGRPSGDRCGDGARAYRDRGRRMMHYTGTGCCNGSFSDRRKFGE